MHQPSFTHLEALIRELQSDPERFFNSEKNQSESKILEYKSSFGLDAALSHCHYRREDTATRFNDALVMRILETIIAFANTDGGVLILGVADAQSRIIDETCRRKCEAVYGGTERPCQEGLGTASGFQCASLRIVGIQDELAAREMDFDAFQRMILDRFSFGSGAHASKGIQFVPVAYPCGPDRKKNAGVTYAPSTSPADLIRDILRIDHRFGDTGATLAVILVAPSSRPVTLKVHDGATNTVRHLFPIRQPGRNDHCEDLQRITEYISRRFPGMQSLEPPAEGLDLYISVDATSMRQWRDGLSEFLARPGVRVTVRQDVAEAEPAGLGMLDDTIRRCDAVVHLTGAEHGTDDAVLSASDVALLLARYPDLGERLGLSSAECATFRIAHWEALLAAYHGIRLYVAIPEGGAESVPGHVRLLQGPGHAPAIRFQSGHHLCLQVYSCLYDLLPSAAVPIAPLLPPSIGRLFKGREGWMARIREAIRSGRGDDAVRVVIHGIGGLGKTRLATEYAYACAHEHTALLMVSGETEQTLKAGLSDLCGVLNLPQAGSDQEETRIKAVQDWLNSPDNRGWLLIVDNVDERDVYAGIVQRVSTLRRGCVLLTSRLDRWPQGFVDLHLDLLAQGAAVDYLLEATTAHRIHLDADQGPGTDHALASTICTRLGCLTLGLVQAAGTINTLRYSLRDYLQDWEGSRELLLHDPDFDPATLGYPRCVAETWLTSYRQLPPESQWVFDVLCWFAPEPIPERVVTNPWPEETLHLLPADVAQAIRLKARRLMAPLYDFSLADKPVGTQRLFRLHQLVQEVGRLWQLREPRDPAPRSLAWDLIEQDFVRSETLDDLLLNIQPELRVVQPHVLHVLTDASLRTEKPLLASRLLQVLAKLCEATGDYSTGSECAAKAVGLAESEYLADSIEAINELVDAYFVACSIFQSRGMFDPALQMGRAGLEVFQSIVASSHENQTNMRKFGIALDSVGRVLENKGYHDEALNHFRDGLEIRKELCRREPDNIIFLRELGLSLDSVGRVWENKGNSDEALSLFEKSLEIFETLRRREPDNPVHSRDVGTALESVGLVLEKKGDYEGALIRYKKVLVIFEDLCRQAPDNLAHRRDLGIAMENVGRMLEKNGGQGGELACCEDLSRMLRDMHRLVSADLTQSGGQSDSGESVKNDAQEEALRLFRKGLEIYEVLTLREPDNLAHIRDLAFALDNVGRVLEKNGEHEDALILFKKSQRIREDLCSHEQDNLVRKSELSFTLDNVGLVLENSGNFEEATTVLRRSMQIRESLYLHDPNNHIYTRDFGVALRNVARVLEKVDDQDGALIFLKKSNEIYEYLCRFDPNNILWNIERVNSNIYCGILLFKIGDIELCVKHICHAFDLLRDIEWCRSSVENDLNILKEMLVRFQLVGKKI